MNTPLMRIENLSKTYDAFKLGPIDLEIPKGCILGLVGQNGAGKSTLLKSLFQLVPIVSGLIYFDGKLITKNDLAFKERISYVSEEQAFYSDMTVGWHLDMAKRFYKQWDDSMSRELLKRFDLDVKKKTGILSKGMRIKLALLIGLSHKAQLLLLDEPTSGLDPLIRTELLQIMQEIMLNEESSILFSSHISSDIEQISDYVAFLHQGNIICFEEKDTLLNDWKRFKFDKNRYTQAFDPHIIGKIDEQFACSTIVKNPNAFKTLFMQTHEKAQFVIDNPNIDDILHHIIKGGQYA